MFLFKRFLSFLPFPFQQALKKLKYAFMLKRGRFVTYEPEYFELSSWIKKGDFVVDAGANIGHYSIKMSDLVGKEGRVFSFEPLPQAFEILSFLSSYQGNENITLVNAALSDDSKIVQMEVPCFETGLANYYVASISENGSKGQKVYCLKYDSLGVKEKISFVKIDVEEHEAFVLKGMLQMVERDRPVLLIEGRDSTVLKQLQEMGYSYREYKNSPNLLFIPQK